MSKPLTVEIHGTGTHNRGAELMAIAIAQEMRSRYENVRIVVPSSFGTYESRAQHQFWLTWEFNSKIQLKGRKVATKLPRPFNRAAFIIDNFMSSAKFANQSFRERCGVLDPKEIDVVLDASGFAFSDQWGVGPAKRLLSRMNGRARQNRQLILLAQALGPFENPAVAKASKKLFERASMVCARDDVSFAAAEKLCPPGKLKQFPDFTLNVEPIVPAPNTLPARFVAMVPNYRMLDKSSLGDCYVDWIEKAMSRLFAAGLTPVFVMHDAIDDFRVIERVNATDRIQVITHSDPRVLKGILGRAEIVIGSRFHALVSSLSQGVPSIGIGWSHKYPELFRDFDAHDLLISQLERPDAFAPLDFLMDGDKRAETGNRIRNAAKRLKEQSKEMWEAVHSHLASV